jgi:hypothetical protein
MKGLLVAVIVVLLAALIGWISFSNSDSSAGITINKQEIQNDTRAAAEKLDEATEEAWEGVRDGIDDDDEDDPVSAPRPAAVEPTP